MNKHIRNSRLGRKIFIIMVICTLGICGIVFAISLYTVNNLQNIAIESEVVLSDKSAEICGNGLISQTEITMSKLAKEKAENHDLVFERIEKEMNTLCQTLTNIYSDKEAHNGYVPPYPLDTEDGVICGRGAIASGVQITPELIEEQKLISAIEDSGAAVYSNDSMLRMILVGSESGIFYRYSDYNNYDENYDARERDWYKNAMASPDKIVWSNAYIEKYGNLVVTCSETYRDGNGDLAGVISCDISIISLIDEVLKGDERSSEYAFILDKNGEYIAHPGYKKDDFSRNPLEDGNEDKARIVNKMVNGESGVGTYEENGVKKYVSYAYIPTTGWSYGIVTTEESILLPVDNTSEVIKSSSEKIQSEMKSIMRNMTSKFNLVFVLCIIVVGVAAFFITSMIVTPIGKLLEGADRIGDGDLEYRLEVKGNDELTDLSKRFNTMTDNLKGYIEDYAKVTAEKERIGAELNVATKIQADMLPRIFPLFANQKNFSIFASMNPAKEVGGDFYDFFMIDERKVGLVIADVSGKGVPAALFMVIAKTLIKNQARTTEDVSEILTSVNNQLCETNGEDMFVTVWMGIVDTETGHMECSNAGHEFPIVKKNKGKFEVIKDKHGLVLGGMDGVKYKKYSIDLEKGDILFVYTDGVPEANNKNNEMYGMDRLEETLNLIEDLSPEAIIEQVKKSVDEFTGEADQFDDITMLCYKQQV